MSQKNFYTAFNIIYSYLKEPLGIYQKEQFYRMIFQDIYALTGDGLYDNDSIRKITSGQTLIHRRVAKKLYTENYIMHYVKEHMWDMTSSELAKELGYTERRISQLIKSITDRQERNQK